MCSCQETAPHVGGDSLPTGLGELGQLHESGETEKNEATVRKCEHKVPGPPILRSQGVGLCSKGVTSSGHSWNGSDVVSLYITLYQHIPSTFHQIEKRPVTEPGLVEHRPKHQ